MHQQTLKRMTSRDKSAVTPMTLSVDESKDSVTDDHLVRPEEKGEGSISWTTYTEYIRAMGGFWVTLGITFSVVLFMAVTVLSSWYLGMVLSTDSKVVVVVVVYF